MLKYLHIFLLSFCSIFINAQSSTTDTISVEKKYELARKLAFNGQYNESRDIALKVHSSHPDYHDITLLIARTYIWEEQYDSAQIYIQEILTSSPENLEAKDALLSISYYSQQMEEVIKYGKLLISHYPERTDIREKLAIAYQVTELNEDAINQADSILIYDANNKIALAIKQQLSPSKPNYELSLRYSFDRFSKPYTRWWQLYTIGLKKNVSFGSIEGKLNIGHAKITGTTSSSATELQPEIESYIHLSQQSYALIGYAYSPHEYFPKHKAVAEVWHQLPKEFVISVGTKYYYWSTNIFIGTASLEKYLGNYWLCYRIYLNFKDVGVTNSHYLTVRRYFNNTNYLQLTAGIGAAPDEPFDIKTDLERLNASSIRLFYQHKLNDRWRLNAGFGYATEEYFNKKYRNRFDGTLGLIYSFGK